MNHKYTKFLRNNSIYCIILLYTIIYNNFRSRLNKMAFELLEYMDTIMLPEFESFVESGVAYKKHASYIQGTMDEFTAF